ncbi:MAG: glutathione peroxidase [Bacteroidia bacterium]
MSDTPKTTIYDIKVKDLAGNEISLDAYKGKVLLIVNTASECGFTPQYRDLEILYKTYKDRGFEVLAFPSNDFGGQEPLMGEEIQHFCSEKYKTTFPVFDKVKVKGEFAHPLFKYLSDKKQNGKISTSPKWNFHKYLIDKNGRVVDYYLSITSPTSSRITKAIEKLL